MESLCGMIFTFLHAIESILTIIIMFMTGWVLTHVGWLDEKTSVIFSKIIVNVSFPCYMLWNLMSNFDKAKLQELSGGLIIPITSILLSYFLSVLVSNLMKIDPKRKGIFRCIFFTSNTIFIGLPVNLSLFGAESTPYVLIYYIANTCFFWTLGNYEISKDGEGNREKQKFSFDAIKKIANPAMAGFVVAIILILLEVQLPRFVMDSCKYIGELTTPLAMFFIGIVLHSTPFKKLRIDRDIIVLLLARFVLCPVVVIALELFIPVPSMMAKVFVIQATMPAVTSTGVIAKQYGADVEFATIATVVTTIASMIVIPIYMILI